MGPSFGERSTNRKHVAGIAVAPIDGCASPLASMMGLTVKRPGVTSPTNSHTAPTPMMPLSGGFATSSTHAAEPNVVTPRLAIAVVSSAGDEGARDNSVSSTTVADVPEGGASNGDDHAGGAGADQGGAPNGDKASAGDRHLAADRRARAAKYRFFGSVTGAVQS
jgi:hypothetical protein